MGRNLLQVSTRFRQAFTWAKAYSSQVWEITIRQILDTAVGEETHGNLCH